MSREADTLRANPEDRRDTSKGFQGEGDFHRGHDPSDPRDKRRFWEDHLRQCRQSGLTQKVYCQQNGLKLPQFYYWKGRLTSDQGKFSFFPVPLPADLSAPQASCAVRILTPNGFAIELQGPVNLSELLSLAAGL